MRHHRLSFAKDILAEVVDLARYAQAREKLRPEPKLPAVVPRVVWTPRV
jgi:hypothetical protein